MSQPKLIIMDEPLASLDHPKKIELLSYIAKKYILKLDTNYICLYSTTETFLLGA